MSGALSIFQKVCPSCAAHIAVDAANCACGHQFEGGGNGTSAEEQALRDEELYENYLAARAGQAAEAARAAAEWLAEEPDNSDRANAAQLAQEVASSLEADLNEQRAKINAMRRVFGPRLTSLSQVTPATAPKPATPAKPPQPAMSKPIAPAPSVAAKPRTTPAPATPRPASTPARPAPSVAPAASTPAASVTPALPSLSSSVKAAAALDAIKRAKAQEAVVAAPAPTVTATPPDSFRAEQAARASRAIAEQPATANSKDCPNCTSTVPLATTRCRCGFTFVSSANDLPSLTLCTGDFTALRNSLKLNLGK